MRIRFMNQAGTVGAKRNATGPLPPALIVAIGRLGEEAAKAGVVVEMDGLIPGAAGLPVRLSEGKRVVTDGPYAEAKEVTGAHALIPQAALPRRGA
jgi:hypothetical protein